jgi:hypothetical protein
VPHRPEFVKGGYQRKDQEKSWQRKMSYRARPVAEEGLELKPSGRFILFSSQEEAFKRKLMKPTTLLLVGAIVLTRTIAFAQTSGGGSAGAGASTGAGNSTGSGGSAGTTLPSTGATINGTGGSPGPNTFNALNHGTAGNSLGAGPAGPANSSTSPRVSTPAANNAVNNLESTDTGILAK